MATFYTASILLVVLILASPLTATLDNDYETAPLDQNAFPTVTIGGKPTPVGFERLDDYSRKDEKDRLHEGIRGITDKIVDHFTNGKHSNMRWLLNMTSDMLKGMDFRPPQFFYTMLAVMIGRTPAAREAGDAIVRFFVDRVRNFFAFFKNKDLNDKRKFFDEHRAAYPIYYKSKTKRSTVEDPIVDNVMDVVSELASKMIDVVEEMMF